MLSVDSPVKALLSTRRSASAIPAAPIPAAAVDPVAVHAYGEGTGHDRERGVGFCGLQQFDPHALAELRLDDALLAVVGDRERDRRREHDAVRVDACEHAVLRIGRDCREGGREHALLRDLSAFGDLHDAQRGVVAQRHFVGAVLVDQQAMGRSACEGAVASTLTRAGRSTGAISKSRNAKIPATPRITATPPTRIARPAPRSISSRRRAVAERPARARARAGSGRCEREPTATDQRSSLACSCSKMIFVSGR